MDKNTIIGLLLITAIIIGFSIYNRPSQEQIAAQKRMQDSLALVEMERAAVTANSVDDTLENVGESTQGSNAADFFGAAAATPATATDTTVAASLAYSDSLSLTASSDKTEQTVVLEERKGKDPAQHPGRKHPVGTAQGIPATYR